jgi:putative membrane protein
MQILYRIIIGFLIGIGAILPGISSGVLCVIFGIYDKLVNSVLNFFRNIKENTKFLLPIIFGISIGIVVFGNLLKKLFNLYPMYTKFAFMGFILGCLPSLFKIANSKHGFRLHYLLYTLLSFILTIYLVILEINIAPHVFIDARKRVIFSFKRFYNVNWNCYSWNK